MGDPKLNGYIAQQLFAILGDESAELGRHLTEALLAHNAKLEMRFLSELGLAQRNQEQIDQVLRLLSQKRIQEALKAAGLYDIS